MALKNLQKGCCCSPQMIIDQYPSMQGQGLYTMTKNMEKIVIWWDNPSKSKSDVFQKISKTTRSFHVLLRQNKIFVISKMKWGKIQYFYSQKKSSELSKM